MSFDTRIEASANDVHFNDTVFLLTQQDVDNPAGEEKISSNKAILALSSPVFFAQFYGVWAQHQSKNTEIEIVDGTSAGFKQMINFINRPKSYEIKVENIIQVFEISYFAHFYQIGSLVSLCRQFLGSYDLGGGGSCLVLDTLRWATSTDHGLDMKKKFPAEHALVLNGCWRTIENSFGLVFPKEEEIKDDQELLDENLMIKILGNQTICRVEEGSFLLLALNYYWKLFEKRVKVFSPRIGLVKTDRWWSEKLETIKTVIDFNAICHQKFSVIIKQFSNKIPDSIMLEITKLASYSWSENGLLQGSFHQSPPFRWDLKDSPKVTFSHLMDTTTTIYHIEQIFFRSVKIKFRINKNAILHINRYSICEICCKPEDEEFCDFCDDFTNDSISFQNEGEYEECVIDSKRDLRWLPYNKLEAKLFKFYVKADKVATLIYERQCSKRTKFPIYNIEEFHFNESAVGGGRETLELEILQVNETEVINGEVNYKPCKSFLSELVFYLIKPEV